LGTIKHTRVKNRSKIAPSFLFDIFNIIGLDPKKLPSRGRYGSSSKFDCIQRALIAFYGPPSPIQIEMGLDTVCIGRPLIGAYDVDIAYFRKRFSVEGR
jgi:hypothetical protein